MSRQRCPEEFRIDAVKQAPSFIHVRPTSQCPDKLARTPVGARSSHIATKRINEASFVRQTDDPIDELNEDRKPACDY